MILIESGKPSSRLCQINISVDLESTPLHCAKPPPKQAYSLTRLRYLAIEPLEYHCSYCYLNEQEVQISSCKMDLAKAL